MKYIWQLVGVNKTFFLAENDKNIIQKDIKCLKILSSSIILTKYPNIQII